MKHQSRIPTTPKKPNRNKTKSLEKDFKFRFGMAKEPIEIATPERMRHTLFYGSPLEGKKLSFLGCVQEEGNQTDFGATFIVDSPEMGDYIVSLAKEAKRKYIWLNPEIHLGVQDILLFMEGYDFDLINQYIIDFEREIRLGHWIIIDLQPYLYKTYSYRSTRLLLTHLKKALIHMKESLRFPHTLYIENPIPLLTELPFFIENGKQLDLSLMIWATSPEDFKTPQQNYLPLIETYVRNLFVHSFHSMSDEPYFASLFSQIDLERFKRQPKISTFFRIMSSETQMIEGSCRFIQLEEEKFKEFKACNKGRKSKLISLVTIQKLERDQYQEAVHQLKENPHLTEEEKNTYQNIVNAARSSKKTFIPSHKKRIPLTELEKKLT